MKFNVIYADPPWSFGSKQLQKYGGTRFHKLTEQYSVMDTNAICALPIGKIADSDCALFLWSTDAHLPDALRVIGAWGFKYSTVAFVWKKLTVSGKTAATLGTWTMKNCELCLLGLKGRMLQYKLVNNIYQLIEAPRTEHSRKPQEARARVEELFGDVPMIELFAREFQDRWITIGNELTGNDIAYDINLLAEEQ